MGVHGVPSCARETAGDVKDASRRGESRGVVFVRRSRAVAEIRAINPDDPIGHVYRSPSQVTPRERLGNARTKKNRTR